MNERIKELAEQAGVMFNTLGATYPCGSLSETLEHFAELVRVDEREAYAKLCESEGHRIDASWESCATAIRGRTE
jgi:hypothetical protein